MEYFSSNPQVPERPLSADDLLTLEPGDDERFERLARRVFNCQVVSSPIYRVFARDAEWSGWRSAPFLPVEAFKWPGIVEPDRRLEAEFLSSATGGTRSRHPICDLEYYRLLSVNWFSRCMSAGPRVVIANLPTYEALGASSSLIAMIQAIMERWAANGSRFITNASEVADTNRDQAILLFGTAFGLLDLVERRSVPLPEGSLVIETGGMKTRRREVDRIELHEVLASGFGVPRTSVLSEFGMCEMGSQFYTSGGETFSVPPWVRVKIVDPERPMREIDPGRPGRMAVFDLANANSVSPLLTSDLARLQGGGVEILGRAVGAEVRGCNYLMTDDP